MCAQEQVSLLDGEEELEQWDASRVLLSTLDKATQSPMVRSSQADLTQPERKGLFWVLDELATSSSVSDTTLVDKLFTSYYTRGWFLRFHFNLSRAIDKNTLLCCLPYGLTCNWG